MAVVACGMSSVTLKPIEFSSSSVFGSSMDMAPLRKSQCRICSPSFELRTPQALGSCPRFEESERRMKVRTHALGSLPDLDMFSDPQ